jgi:hypothetical protein
MAPARGCGAAAAGGAAGCVEMLADAVGAIGLSGILGFRCAVWLVDSLGEDAPDIIAHGTSIGSGGALHCSAQRGLDADDQPIQSVGILGHARHHRGAGLSPQRTVKLR